MLQKTIRGIIIFIIIVLIGYIVLLKMPQASVGSKTVVAELSADEIYQAFIEDEQTAQQNYQGKAVVVRGKIGEKYEDENGAPVVILNNSDGTPATLVTLEYGEKSKITQYNIDDEIRVKALCSGLLMEVTLNKGIILE